ncbi:MAG: aminotransferase class I/II-fold pyridoxal phosphate-dependent enzyme [Akkermansia sp.]
MPEFIASALWKAMDAAVPYPSPDMAELRELAAVHYGLPSGCFTFGNGANELIHALPRALELKRAVIPEPAFSEYRLACLRHGTDVLSIRTEERNSFLPSLCRLEEQAADGSAVFLANPSNPSGGLLDAAALHRVVQSRPEVLWIIDESFMDYVQGAESLLREAALLPNLVVLRSLTVLRHGRRPVRFFHLRRPLAERLRQSLPAWNVNAFAAAAVKAVLAQPSSWADRERTRNRERRDDLFRRLSSLPGSAVLPSEANFLLFRLAGAPHGLAARLLKNTASHCATVPIIRGWKRAAGCAPASARRRNTPCWRKLCAPNWRETAPPLSVRLPNRP